MKNHIVFKFIAIVLCAASLLGAVGSGLGIFAMSEMGLYDRSVDEAYQTYVEGYVDSLAIQIVERYAAMNLGGANSQLADAYYGSYWSSSSFDMGRVGYTIWDENGNAVQEQTLYEGYPVAQEFIFDTTDGYSGSYIRIVSETPQSDISPELPEPVITNIGEDYVYNAIPEEGVDVYFLDIGYEDGEEYGIASPDESLGTIFRLGDGSVMFRSVNTVGDSDMMDRYPVFIRFQTIDGQLIYEASSPNGVMDTYHWSIDSGCEIVCRNLEGECVVYDAIPMGGCWATRLTVTYADGFCESAGGAPNVGYLNYDENGYVRFLTEEGILESGHGIVTAISFYDENDALVYRAYNAEGVGMFYQEKDTCYFLADMLGEGTPAVEGTLPVQEETGGTAPYRYVDDNVPKVPADGALVYWLEYWDENAGDVCAIAGTQVPLGEVFWNANDEIVFRCRKDFGLSGEVIYLCLRDINGETLFETYTAGVEIGWGDAVGQFTLDDGGDPIFITDLTYAAAGANTPMVVSETPVEETAIPTVDTTEVTEETVPPTVETMAETSEEETIVATEVPDTEQIQPTETVFPTGWEESSDTKAFSYYDYVSGEYMEVKYVYEDMPAYTVTVQLASGAMTYEYEWVLMRLLYEYQSDLPMVLGFCLLIFAVLAVYLCCAAGKKPGTTEVHAAGLNCIPLDLYAVGAVGGVALAAVAGLEGTQYLLRSNITVALMFLGLMAYAASLLVVGFCFACAAQFKTPGGFWWRNTLCGWCLRFVAVCWRWLWKACTWLGEKFESKLEPALVKLFKGVWRVVLFFWGLFVKAILWIVHTLEKGTDWLGKKLNRFFSMLPLTWQWLLVGFGMVIVLFLAIFNRRDGGILLLGVGAAVAIIVYGAHCFGVLLESTKRMSQGDLDEKVDDKLLTGSFKEFAGELNGLADVAVVAAQKQLKSERMKTELITNVSHDIKTPLTSIINYVDLLQKPHTDAEQAQYLEVLDRQSQRLKKLIDDLMEMSKASTGNLSVDITRVDAGEAVNQALGEFADKLDKVPLIPVFRQPEEPVLMMADGRLVWRVMSNLLSNAVKYALPGTRLYVDLQKLDGKVIISMKNISREELNVNADELLERFVRGDASRNTEGSGLGLNIAQSLMELQKGQLQILVDGDLFKVTLIFPGV